VPRDIGVTLVPAEAADPSRWRKREHGNGARSSYGYFRYVA
jgi:hypothetical protein